MLWSSSSERTFVDGSRVAKVYDARLQIFDVHRGSEVGFDTGLRKFDMWDGAAIVGRPIGYVDLIWDGRSK